MKLPVCWLKKYIDVSLTPEKLSDLLTMSGSKVDSLHGKGEDAVIDIEVTTNRPDCLSILGLSHEVSAITGKKVRWPSEYFSSEKQAKSSTVVIDIQDKKGCPRYTARIIEGVSVGPAPVEAQRLLTLCGTRAISNVVDVTNYVLFESGQPMHAFDLDKLKGAHLIVRLSKKGEKFIGIDGIEYTLDEKTLVIADEERVIAIAGVLGGKLTEVTSSTKNVLLESAYFDPALVRQAAKKYKISTESSYRFERGVDIENIGRASLRASSLLREWAGGRDTSGLIDKDFSPKKKRAPLTLRTKRVEDLLGLKVSQGRIASILRSLSFSVQSSEGRLRVTPPSSRRDMVIEADLIEEVLRIEGFDKAPETLPIGHRGNYRDQKAERLPELKKFLSHLGLDEIMTYSLLSEKGLSQSGITLSDCHAVANAVSAEQAFFRPALLPGALQAVLFNAHRKADSLRFFEIGNCYEKGREETRLSITLFGASEANWQRKNDSSFYELKGLLTNVLDHLNADMATSARLEEVSGGILRNWGILRPVYFCELPLDTLLEARRPVFKVRPIPKYPWVRRDIAVVADIHVQVGELEQVMRQAGAPTLKDVALFDQFMGKDIPKGKRSLAFSLAYQKEDGTFTDNEVQLIQQKIGEALKSKFNVEFR